MIPPQPPALLDGPVDPALLEDVAGDYAFPGGGVLPAEGGVFVLEAPGRDAVRFDCEGGRVVGLTVNPAKWWVVAERVR